MSNITGHRQRLRQRVLDFGAASLADYEILEFLLFATHSRKDVKPLAKDLLMHFKTLHGVLTASPTELQEVCGVSDNVIAELKVVENLLQRVLKFQATKTAVLDSLEYVVNYCMMTMSHLRVEHIRVFYLNSKNKIILDEVVQRGTVNFAFIYPREILRRALEKGANALIVVHNHPSGDPAPSEGDIQMTQKLKRFLESVDIIFYDHIIIGHTQYVSFRKEGLI